MNSSPFLPRAFSCWDSCTWLVILLQKALLSITCHQCFLQLCVPEVPFFSLLLFQRSVASLWSWCFPLWMVLECLLARIVLMSQLSSVACFSAHSVTAPSLGFELLVMLFVVCFGSTELLGYVSLQCSSDRNISHVLFRYVCFHPSLPLKPSVTHRVGGLTLSRRSDFFLKFFCAFRVFCYWMNLQVHVSFAVGSVIFFLL